MTVAPEIYLSETVWPEVKAYIEARLRRLYPEEPQTRIKEIRGTSLTYEAVASHADLYCCRLGDRILTGTPAGPAYPENIGYCGAQLGRFFVHNLDCTAPELRREVKRLGLTEIHVRQGYTKCNLVVVRSDERPAVITSDRGILKALAAYPIDVLEIEPGHVELPGLSQGFLGGASGSLTGEILFNGDLSVHPDFEKIRRFICEKNRTPRWFSDLPLRDAGSIITLL